MKRAPLHGAQSGEIERFVWDTGIPLRKRIHLERSTGNAMEYVPYLEKEMPELMEERKELHAWCGSPSWQWLGIEYPYELLKF